MDIKRGREKTVASPDGEARKKKGSLFRRASLSRKKNKEEAKMRSKSKDRYAEHSQSTNTLSMANKVERVSKTYKTVLESTNQRPNVGQHSNFISFWDAYSFTHEFLCSMIEFRWRAWFFRKEKSQIFIPTTWPQITFRSAQFKNQKQRFCSKANFGSWKYCSYKTTGRLCQTKWLPWRRFTWNCQKFNLWNRRSWFDRSKYLSKSWS